MATGRKKSFKQIMETIPLKRKLIALAGLELLLAVAAIAIYVYKVSHLSSYSFGREQIESFSEGKCIAGTINESYEPGIYDIVPETLLAEGQYEYRLFFEGSSGESFAWPHGYTTAYRSFTQETVYLQEGNSGTTTRFWVYNKTDMALRLCYSGSGEVTFTGYELRETPVLAQRTLFFELLFLGASDLALLFCAQRRRGKIPDSSLLYGALLLGVTLIVSYPCFMQSVMAGNDMDFHMARLESLKDGLLEGQFPVRISPDFYEGYGYANSVFYGEMFLYVPALLRICGFTLTEVYQFYLICVNLLTVFGGYWAFRRILGEPSSAFLATVLYAMAPYRLCNLYVRGAMGEFTAMAFLPIVLYGVYRIYTERVDSAGYGRSYLPLLVGLSGVIQSHILSVEMVGFSLLGICVVLLPLTLQKKRFLMLVKTAVLTGLVNLWFLLPFLDYTKTMDLRFKATVGQKMIQGTGAYLIQLFNVFPIYATASVDGSYGFRDDLPLSLGPALILGVILCLSGCLMRGQGSKPKQCFLFGGAALLFGWMATIYFPWDKVFSLGKTAATFVSSIQFTWRFLGLGSVMAAAAAGLGIQILKTREERLSQAIAAAMGTVAVVGGLYLMQMCVQNMPLYEYTDLDSLQFGTVTAAMGGEYVLSSAKHDVITQISEPEAFGDVEIREWKKSGTTILLDAQSEAEGGYVLLPLLNYKGYTAKGDGGIGKMNLEEGDGARIRLNLPPGFRGQVKVYFASPWYWRLSEIVSIMTICGIVGGGIIYKKKK